MPTNKGLLREDEFVYFLDHKKPKYLSENLKEMLESLFGIVDPNLMVYCKKTVDYIKPDIIIKHRKIEKAVSIKSGHSQGLHCEQIKPFILFLRSLGISNRTQQTILLFLYGDGTMDGTGEKRYSQHDVCKKLAERIKAANFELNRDVGLIEKFVDRIMFSGVDPNATKADVIYAGDVNKGIVVTKEQIMKHLSVKDWSVYDNLHIGPIFLNAGARYVDRPIKNEKKRHIIECYWPRFKEDMAYIARRYTQYHTPYLQKSKVAL